MTVIAAVATGASLVLAPGAHAEGSKPVALSDKARPGQLLFEDASLSDPPGQACATCHGAALSFADPDRRTPTSKGVRPGLFGDRNTPSAAYMAFRPKFHFDAAEQHFIGGQFWDGRAATLEEQAREDRAGPCRHHTLADPHPERAPRVGAGPGHRLHL